MASLDWKLNELDYEIRCKFFEYFENRRFSLVLANRVYFDDCYSYNQYFGRNLNKNEKTILVSKLKNAFAQSVQGIELLESRKLHIDFDDDSGRKCIDVQFRNPRT